MNTQERIDTICENFWGKFAWCDLQNSEDNKRMNDWLRTTLTTLVDQAFEEGRDIGMKADEVLREEGRKEEREKYEPKV